MFSSRLCCCSCPCSYVCFAPLSIVTPAPRLITGTGCCAMHVAYSCQAPLSGHVTQHRPPSTIFDVRTQFSRCVRTSIYNLEQASHIPRAERIIYNSETSALTRTATSYTVRFVPRVGLIHDCHSWHCLLPTLLPDYLISGRSTSTAGIVRLRGQFLNKPSSTTALYWSGISIKAASAKSASHLAAV